MGCSLGQVWITWVVALTLWNTVSEFDRHFSSVGRASHAESEGRWFNSSKCHFSKSTKSQVHHWTGWWLLWTASKWIRWESCRRVDEKIMIDWLIELLTWRKCDSQTGGGYFEQWENGGAKVRWESCGRVDKKIMINRLIELLTWRKCDGQTGWWLLWTGRKWWGKGKDGSDKTRKVTGEWTR